MVSRKQHVWIKVRDSMDVWIMFADCGLFNCGQCSLHNPHTYRRDRARSASDQSKLIAFFDIFFLIIAALCLLYCAAGIFAEIFLSIRDCAGDVMALLFTKNKIAPSPSPPSTVVQDGAPPPPPPPDHDHLPV